MINVICTLMVTFCIGELTGPKCDGIPAMQLHQLSGKIVSQSSSKYIVDFSKDAIQTGVMGDYSRKLVEKSECVKVK